MPLSEQSPASLRERADSAAFPPLAWLLLVLAALWCIAWFLHARGYWEDDAYIHLEFARSLAEGHGFAFNGTVVYGDTSPLWVWLLVGFHHFIPGWLTAGKTLVALAAVLSLAGAFFFARSLTLDLPRSRSFLFAAAMVLLFATNPYFGYWAYSGMEALAAAGLVCWACVAIAPAQLSTPRFLLSAFLAGIAPLLRPEMGFFTVLVGLVLLDRLLKSPTPIPRRLAELIAGLVLIAAPGIAWGLYALHTFGRILPNTNAAKRADPGESVVLRLFNVYGLGFPVVLIGIAVLLAWLVIRYARGKGSERRPRVLPLLHAGGWLLFLWTAISCIFYVANHTYVQTRYIFVSAPVLTIALLALALKLSPRLYRAGLIFGLLFGIVISLDATWPLIHNKVGIDRGYAALAAFFDTLPPDAPVAHYSIGEAAFLSRHPLIDTGGITRPGIIPYMSDPTDARRLAWMLSQGARYIVMDHQPEPGATLVWHLQIPTSGWFLNRRRYAERDTLEVWKLP